MEFVTDVLNAFPSSFLSMENLPLLIFYKPAVFTLASSQVSSCITGTNCQLEEEHFTIGSDVYCVTRVHVHLLVGLEHEVELKWRLAYANIAPSDNFMVIHCHGTHVISTIRLKMATFTCAKCNVWCDLGDNCSAVYSAYSSVTYVHNNKSLCCNEQNDSQVLSTPLPVVRILE